MKETDTFQCDVVCQSTVQPVPIVTEPCRDSMVGHKKIVVSFNPTVAGEYHICIAVNRQYVGGEVYRKVYTAGETEKSGLFKYFIDKPQVPLILQKQHLAIKTECLLCGRKSTRLLR